MITMTFIRGEKYNNFSVSNSGAVESSKISVVIEQVRNYIRKQRLVNPGDRVAVAVSGGADSVALLRVLIELRGELGVVLSVAHFHHGIRGAEADADAQFVAELARQFDLELHSGGGDAPAYAREHRVSLETAARELRHGWFAEMLATGKATKIASAHTLDDQAETVLMHLIRGAGSKGLAGIAPEHAQKGLIRPLLSTSRAEVEDYLRKLNQLWHEDSTNVDLAHTRNRVRRVLLPLLERDFNPAIRHTLADLADLARHDAEFWDREVAALLPRALLRGKPSRSGRSTTGTAAGVWSLDLAVMQSLPLAVQRHLLQKIGAEIGVALDVGHIQGLTDAIASAKAGSTVALPAGICAKRTFRELQFYLQAQKAAAGGYSVTLPVPGEVAVEPLGAAIRARVIKPGDDGFSGYNPAFLLDRAQVQAELVVRNWRAGDRYFPAHTRSPRKVKELLQPARLGRPLDPAERSAWPVVEIGGQIVWLRGFPVPEAYAWRGGEAVLIEEVDSNAGNGQ